MEFEFIAEFIVLADALHYGKAARQLKCDPSTLSKHIKKLEDQLGAVLFVRDRRTVTLTPAGHTFRQDAPRILDAVFQARRLAVRVSDAANSFVRVGQIGVGQDILRAALRSVHRQHPDVEVSLTTETVQGGIDDLRHDRIDLLLTRPPIHDETIAEAWLTDEPLVLALPADHPAPDESPALSDLAETPLILPGAAQAPGAHATIKAVCDEVGLRPPRTHHVDSVDAALILIGAGLGAGLAPESATKDRPDPDIQVRPITEVPARIALHEAWRRDDNRPILMELRHSLSEQAAAQRVSDA